MNIQIYSKNLELTDQMKAIIQKKFSDKINLLLTKFNEEMKTADLSIEVDKKHSLYKTRFDIALPGSSGQIFSQNSNIDFTGAITGLREQVEKQIKKYKQDLANY